MAGDLTILNYRGTLPTYNRDVRKADTKPLGTARKVKAEIERYIPDIEWEREPPLLELLQLSGAEVGREWDAEMLASASIPTQNGHCHTEQLSLSFCSLPVEDDAMVSSLAVVMRAVGNPYVALWDLCKANGWVAIGPNPDDEFVDFAQAIAEWEDWVQNADKYRKESRAQRQAKLEEIAAQKSECMRFEEQLVRDGARCPQCGESHADWRCVVPDNPERLAYFVCRKCGRSVQREQFAAE